MNTRSSFPSESNNRQTPTQLSGGDLDTKLEMVALLVGLLSSVTGVIVLFGWAFDITLLKSLLPCWVSMKVNTALTFTLTGMALMLTTEVSSPLANRGARLCTLLVGLIGLLTLCEYLFAWNPGFDQWLFTEPAGTVGTSNPGRMAPHAALCFLLLAIGLGFAWDKGKLRRLFTSVTISLLVAIIALVDLYTHLTRPFDVYGLWGFTVMAVHTAMLFAILGLTIAWGAWPRGISILSLSGRSVGSFAVWTLLLTGTLMWNLQNEGHDTLESATATARANIRKDISFRSWAASHGGVYVKPTEKTPPNPYLKVPNRDVVTTSGMELTLMNPAYIMRELQHDFSLMYGISSRITSLKPINPINVPDAWEAKALVGFEQGEDEELSEVQQIGGQPYLRMIAPIFVESGCLKCHGDQGYKLGDIRGGIDTAVPMLQLFKEQRESSTNLLIAYGLIWGLGMIGMRFFYRRERRLDVENQQEKAFSAAIIKSLPGTFYVYEDGLRLVRWNKNLEAISGYTADELLNKPLLDWFADKDRLSAEAEFNKVAEMGEVKFEAELILKEKTVPFLLTGSWMILGEKKYLIGLGLDLTEQKKLEEGLRQAQKMESMGTLAGGIAHDFNNILAAIIGYTELAVLQAEENEPCRNELTEVLKASERAVQLVRQILTFSRKKTAEKNPLQIYLIIKEALKLLRATIPTTIEIRQEIISQATVMADPTQIHQVIMNLCTNAYHAMMDRGGVLGVTLDDIVLRHKIIDGDTELSAGRYVLLAVSDTGCGMDKETMGKIFDPYFTTKGEGKGTGLGLAVVHGIVKGHHGRITVYSEPGQGTTFKVYLPIIESDAAELNSSEVAPPVSIAHERIIVVDDEIAIRETHCKMLTEAGYRVDAYPNGLEAWQALSKSPNDWDLILTDQTMPEMTGIQLADKALAIRPDLAIILCSGYSSIVNGDIAQGDRLSAYLQKPISRNTLLTQVAKALEKKILISTC